jgi:branched-chain amino acid transport system ATP-binding protein
MPNDIQLSTDADPRPVDDGVGLVIDDLRVGYARNEVIHGVSFAVPAGARVALVGANGAGKTTILRSICGMLKPSSGSIHFSGTRLNGRTAHAIAILGVSHIPEGRRIFPSLSVDENLRIAGYRRGKAHVKVGLERVYEVFPRLAERRDRPAGVLSGGEQQMVALGRAIVAAPRLLLLDEMSLGLAPMLVTTLYDQLGMLFPAGTTMLIVEQNVSIALKYCETAIVLRSGVIAASGATRGFRDNAKELHAAFLGLGKTS